MSAQALRVVRKPLQSEKVGKYGQCVTIGPGGAAREGTVPRNHSMHAAASLTNVLEVVVLPFDRLNVDKTNLRSIIDDRRYPRNYTSQEFNAAVSEALAEYGLALADQVISTYNYKAGLIYREFQFTVTAKSSTPAIEPASRYAGASLQTDQHILFL